MPAPSAYPQPPFKIAKEYDVYQSLGQTSLGVAYLARTSYDEVVSVKMLAPESPREEIFVKRFRTLGEKMQTMGHQNLAAFRAVVEYPINDKVGDVTLTRNAVCIILEHIPGKTIADMIAERGCMPMDPLQVVEWGDQIAQALHYCHNQGVVLRSVTPSGIVIDKRNRPRIIDFSISKDAGFDPNTATGTNVGDTAYMSPEQITAAPSLDGRSDVYSLGCVLFEMLTGHKVFESDQPMVQAYSHVRHAPRSMKTIVPSMNPKIEAIVMKCLAKKPEDRFQSAAEAAEALRLLSTDLDLARMAGRIDLATNTREADPNHFL